MATVTVDVTLWAWYLWNVADVGCRKGKTMTPSICEATHPGRTYASAYLGALVTAGAMTEDEALLILWGNADLWMCEQCEGWFPEQHMQDSEGLCSFCVEVAA